MIFDTLENAYRYAGLNENIDRVLEIAKTIKAEDYETGKIEINENAYIGKGAYETHPIDTAVMEAHQKYVDVMIMVEGEETIYVKPTSQLANIYKPYDPAIEALLADFEPQATPIRLTAGSFVVLFPGDAHSPGCNTETSHAVKKMIGKVRIAD